MPNGIGILCTNFLRTTCLYTECLLSFQTGTYPTERTTADYSSCFYFFDFTNWLFPQGTVFPWVLSLFLSAGLCTDAVPFTLHRYRVSFQNPTHLSRKHLVKCLLLMMSPSSIVNFYILSSRI